MSQPPLLVQPPLDPMDFDSFEDIGSGGYGTIFRARWNGIGGGCMVAVKEIQLVDQSNKKKHQSLRLQPGVQNLTIQQENEKLLKQVDNELQMLASLSHPNVISFYGFYEMRDVLGIVMEFMEGGSLNHLLEDCNPSSHEQQQTEYHANYPTFMHERSNVLTWKQKIHIFKQILRGLNYLHHRNVVHRDMKSHNVLLRERGIDGDGQIIYDVKLCDFGLSRVKSMSQSKIQTRNDRVGTVRWTAPECTQQIPEYSGKSDMFSIGMLLFEMIAHNIPFDEIDNDLQVLYLIRMEKERPFIPADRVCPPLFKQMMEWCWDHDPHKRPTALELLKFMEDHHDEFEKIPSIYDRIPEPVETDDESISVEFIQPQHSVNSSEQIENLKVDSSEKRTIQNIRVEVVKSTSQEDDSKFTTHIIESPSFMKPFKPNNLFQSNSTENNLGIPIIIDNGQYITKAGFAGDQSPRILFPTLVGVPVASYSLMSPKKRYIGHETISDRSLLDLKSPAFTPNSTNEDNFSTNSDMSEIPPIKVGSFVNNNQGERYEIIGSADDAYAKSPQSGANDWDAFELIWKHVFDELGKDPKDQPCIISTAPLISHKDREKLYEIMFETFSVPLLRDFDKCILSVYGMGKSSALIVDVGFKNTFTYPVIGGKTGKVMNSPIGGYHVTSYLSLLTKSWSQYCDHLTMSDVKEHVCFCSNNNNLERKLTSENYQLPDGQVVELKSERYKAADLLFDQKIIESVQRTHPYFFQNNSKSLTCGTVLTLQDLISQNLRSFQSDYESIQTCQDNIVLTGGGSMLCDMPQRLNEELQRGGLLPFSKFNLSAPDDRKFLTFLGGSILAGITNNPMWISRQEYEECGPSIISQMDYH